MNLYFSTAHRWMRCAQSLTIPRRRVDYDMTAANEGTAVDWVIDKVLLGDASIDDMEAEIAPNGTEITNVMLSYAGQFIKDMQPILGDCESAETQAKVGFDKADGRIDFFGRGADHLVILDYKYGHNPVYAFENWQLLFGAFAADMGERTFSLIIYQPRAAKEYVIDEWFLTRDELLVYRERALTRMAQLSRGVKDATAGTHCLYCDHAAECDTLGHEIEVRARTMNDTMDLAYLRELQRMVKTRTSAVEADITARMRSGEYVEGWCMAPTYGQRKLTIDPITAQTILGVDTTKQVARSVAEIERLGVPADILDAITTRPLSGHKVQPVAPDDGHKLFGPPPSKT